MTIDRRRLLAVSALTGAVPLTTFARPAGAAPLAGFGVDATQLGVRAGGGADQSHMLQSAIDKAAGARVPLMLGPGDYRVGGLSLPTGTQLIGVRGATRLVFSGGSAMIAARGADHVTLAGLVLEGAGKPMPEDGALIAFEQCNDLRITDCEVTGSGRGGIRLYQIGGVVSGNTVANIADVAIYSLDARGLSIQNNVVRGAGNGGILVHRSEIGDDGTLITDNRIEDIDNRDGGSGQFGNAINVFRASNVIVRGNRISRAAYSAVRGNSASNIQITGNTATDVGEVAIYSEFGFQGAVIANNTVDGAAVGIVTCNFNEGGRLAVVQGNLIRNLKPKRPIGAAGDGGGVGIAVEADAAVTGNVVENAPSAGIMIGWGSFMRDVSVTGNVVRSAPLGVAVSVVRGAGTAVITGNLISDASHGAIVGMDHARAVTGDLSQEPTRYANLQISGNRVR